MKFSTRTAYGLQVMIFLALQEKQNSIKTISLKDLLNENIKSLSYLERVLRILKKNKLISTIQGRNGGYCLAKSPEEITIREILEVLEGDLYPYKCMDKKCKSRSCISKSVWNHLYSTIYNSLESLSLEDLINNK